MLGVNESGATARDRRQHLVTLACVGAWILALLLLAYQHGVQSGWVYGDWLIDYRQGFVRRGLPGQFTGWIGALLPGGALDYAAVFVALLWSAFLVGLWLLLSQRQKPIWYLFLFLSPAGFLAYVYGADQVGRKEILLFASLTWFAVVHRWLTSPPLPVVLLLSCIGIVLTLSHEMAVFYAPYFIIAGYWAGGGRFGGVAGWAMALGLVVGAAMLLAFGQTFDGRAFCSSLVQDESLSSSVCLGTITWPVLTVTASVSDAMKAIDAFDYPRVYTGALALALTPVAFWALASKRSVTRTDMFALSAALVASMPLFLLAVDWGRFIQTHLVLAAVVLALRLPAASVGEEWRWNWLKGSTRWCVVALFALSYLVWHMPVCCQDRVGYGLVDRLGGLQRLLR